MGAGGSSEASVPGPPGAAGPGAVGAGHSSPWGLLVTLLVLAMVAVYSCYCCCPRRSSSGTPHPRAHQDGVGGGVGGGSTGGQGGDAQGVGGLCTPTIILLPQGRMLLVDGAVLSSLQADASGLDLIRLGENLVRAQRRQDSTILDAESGLTGLTGLAGLMGRKEGQGVRTLGGGPPTYEELFGMDLLELQDECASSPPRSPPACDREDDDGDAAAATPSPESTPGADSATTATLPPSYEEVLDPAGPRSPHQSQKSPTRPASSCPSPALSDGDVSPRTPAGSAVASHAGTPLLGTPQDDVDSSSRRTTCQTSSDADQSIRESRV